MICVISGCDKRPVFQNKNAFEQRIPGFGWVKMPCAGGTTYNPTDCECTQHADYLHDKSKFFLVLCVIGLLDYTSCNCIPICRGGSLVLVLFNIHK